MIAPPGDKHNLDVNVANGPAGFGISGKDTIIPEA